MNHGINNIQGSGRKVQENHIPQSKHQILGFQVSGVSRLPPALPFLAFLAFPPFLALSPCSMPSALCALRFQFFNTPLTDLGLISIGAHALIMDPTTAAFFC